MEENSTQIPTTPAAQPASTPPTNPTTNQTPISTTPPPPPSENNSTEVKPKGSGMKSKMILILVIVLLVIILAAGGVFFWKNMMNRSEPAPNPEETQEIVEEISPEPTVASSSSKLEKTFTSEKFADLSFEGYSLMYPQDWILSEERDEKTPISTVTLSKTGYVLKIFQAATGGAGCIYEGQLPEGPASDYRNNEYKDLTTGFGILRQTESLSNSKMSYSYCQQNENDNSYGQPTSVGHISLTTQVANPDLEIITEVEEIIKSIKTL